jgi:ubiquinone/menaquinone biosynthesis C-methylase UbiE
MKLWEVIMPMRFFRKFKDLGITGNFTKWYDKNTKETRLLEMQSYAQEVAKHLKDKSKVLEVAPGPGYLSIALAKMGNFEITGMDISHDFIKICKDNAKRENVSINFLQGNVSSIPFADGTFDFIVCSAAFKNFKDPVTALKEMHRVLNENGIALIIDMNRNASKEELKEEAEKASKPGLERWFQINTFRMLCKNAYGKDTFYNMAKQTLFKKTEVEEIGIGLKVYLYK